MENIKRKNKKSESESKNGHDYVRRYYTKYNQYNQNKPDTSAQNKPDTSAQNKPDTSRKDIEQRNDISATHHEVGKTLHQLLNEMSRIDQGSVLLQWYVSDAFQRFSDLFCSKEGPLHAFSKKALHGMIINHGQKFINEYKILKGAHEELNRFTDINHEVKKIFNGGETSEEQLEHMQNQIGQSLESIGTLLQDEQFPREDFKDLAKDTVGKLDMEKEYVEKVAETVKRWEPLDADHSALKASMNALSKEAKKMAADILENSESGHLAQLQDKLQELSEQISERQNKAVKADYDKASRYQELSGPGKMKPSLVKVEKRTEIFHEFAQSDSYAQLVDKSGKVIFTRKEYNSIQKIEKSSIMSVFDDKPFSPKALIDTFKKNPYLKRQYEGDTGVKEKLTLEQHTKKVMELFEKYFAKKWEFDILSRDEFRLMLALHDVGKPKAVKETGETAAQHEYTYPMVRIILERLQIPDAKAEVIAFIIKQDHIGNHIKFLCSNKYGPGQKTEKTLERRKKMSEEAKELNTNFEDYFELLKIYHMCDAGSYPKLANHFEFQESLSSMTYSERTQGRVDTLLLRWVSKW